MCGTCRMKAKDFSHRLPLYKYFLRLTTVLSAWKLPLSQTSSVLWIFYITSISWVLLSRGINSTITSLFYVIIAIQHDKKITVLVWYKVSESMFQILSLILNPLCSSKDLWATCKCFSLFGLIHILLDTEKPLSVVAPPLMPWYVTLSRWHRPICQGLDMSDCKRCFLLEGKGFAQDSIKPSNSLLALPLSLAISVWQQKKIIRPGWLSEA